MTSRWCRRRMMRRNRNKCWKSFMRRCRRRSSGWRSSSSVRRRTKPSPMIRTLRWASRRHDGTLMDKARVIFETLDRAAASNMRVDYLLSPHYFPEWAMKQAPDIANGNIGFLGINIDHPLVRDTIEKFATAMAKEMKDKPSL